MRRPRPSTRQQRPLLPPGRVLSSLSAR
jgi:hypothetical protein